MKQTLLIIGIGFLAATSVNAQTDKFTQDFQPVRAELTKWDPIRGEWLASSMVSIAKHEPIPDRTFPENFTPAEMLKMVPDANRTSIEQIAANNTRNSDSLTRSQWNSVSNMVSRTTCVPVIGRTYGDPHLKSFDGATYSFQTVGEFVIAKSANRNFEIQTRQQPQADDFSLNTALAMNVGGDRVCIYANEKPDNISNCALRLNGSPIYVTNGTYFLPHGGTIRYSSNNYVITWPTGEKATVDLRHSSQFDFLNIAVQIFPCAQSDMQGLLGNANGRQNDDFDVAGSSSQPSYMAFSSFGSSQMQQASDQMEREYLAFLAKDYARQFRVTPVTSLFDYGIGQSTYAYTDESFPRVHRTVGQLSPDRQNMAKRKCEEDGIRGDELKGCIYDNAYLQIPPSPNPVIRDHTQGIVLEPISKPIRNVNGGGRENFVAKPIDFKPNAQPIEKNPTNEMKPVKVEQTDVIKKDTHETVKPIGTKPESQPVSKPVEINTTKPSSTTVKPSTHIEKPQTNSKPVGTGTTTNPVKTTPVLKPGKG